MNEWLIIGGVAAFVVDFAVFARYRGRVRHLGLYTFPIFVLGMALLLTGVR